MNDRKKAVHVGTVVLETVKDHLWLSFAIPAVRPSTMRPSTSGGTSAAPTAPATTARMAKDSQRNGGVQVSPLVHGADPLRVGVRQAVLCKDGGHGGRAPEPVGVDPCLQRKPPGVGLGQQHVQRVKARVLPLHAGAQVAPREEAAPVKRISKGAHLRNDGVQPEGQAVVHQRGGIGPERAF